MNIIQLEEYQAQEDELFEGYRKKVAEHGIQGAGQYPGSERFSKLIQPVVVCDRSVYLTYKEKIWSQIPFAGTLLIPLDNLKKENLMAGNGFEVREIQKLVDLAQDKGRVQFFLTSNATAYEGLNHLDPILENLKPPIFRSVPIEALAGENVFRGWMEEFYRVAHPAYDRYLAGEMVKINETPQFIANVKVVQSKVFACLKYLGMDQMASIISEKLSTDPKIASDLLAAIEELIGHSFDAFPACKNMNFEAIRFYRLTPFFQQRDIVYPIDSGRFMMEKMTLLPDSYDGCINVIENYQQNDLYKVVASLERGIKRHEKDNVLRNIQELTEVMDNIWTDANKIKLANKGIKFGVSITLGAMGAFAAMSLTGLPGLLVALAGSQGGRFFDMIDNDVGKKLMKLTNRDYLANIYDFKKKNNLTEK